MVKLRWTQNFKEEYKALSVDMKRRVKKQLELLRQNPRHPSLNIKKMDDPRGIWEGRITRSYRFTFHVEKDTYILRRVGTHDILKNP
jgi:mRNA-degrading endonuclease RelE of RelBE toxin-antitoxin system